jgi:hypothetical protein
MSKNKQTHLERISKGIAIYKVDASPFWYARIWNARKKRYTVRTTKCVLKADAIEEAFSIKNDLGGVERTVYVPKEFSFEHFARRQMVNQQRLVKSVQRSPRYVQDDVALLERPKDGILSVFGKRDIREIEARDLREYLEILDADRAVPLSADTQKRHLGVIRKIINLAREDGVVAHLPVFPKIQTKDAPRPSFSPDELRHLYQVLRSLANEGQGGARGGAITRELYDLCVFLAHTGLRPTIKEVYSLRHSDVCVVEDETEPHLFLTIRQGKTGYRNSYGTPIAKERYEDILKRSSHTEPDDWVFFPGISNRQYASSMASRQFKFAVNEAGLANDALGQDRVLYSLRHYYIQQRLANHVPVYELANNVGTSVEMIERFYGKFPAHSLDQAASINKGMQKGS